MSENKLSKNDDLRIKRTCKLLSNALFSLLEERPFNEIYVMDICDKAMVHRSTFYKHFEDKYHLLKYTLTTFQNEMMSKVMSETNMDNPTQFFMSLIDHAFDLHTSSKRSSPLMMVNDEDSMFMTAYHNTISQGILSRLEEFKKKGITFSMPLSILANYNAGAIISIQRWWLENNMPISKEELLSYIEQIISSSMSACSTI